jgi:hypothetical protein
MKECFIDWRPAGKSKNLLSKVMDVINSYEAQGYILTLRQLYYQMVSRDYIPNSIQSYSNMGNLVSNARLAGIIDWDSIEDRVRVAQGRQHWDSPEDILLASSRYYRDHWEIQPQYVEVWCEKDAVSNILQPVCSRYDVTFMANRGYSSQSAMYEAHQRLENKIQDDKEVFVIYFGDHDPSGLDMTRDIEDRMGLFLYGEGAFNNVEREALNMDQIRQYNPPENPAKTTDSRYKKYRFEHGVSSWELDALEPAVLSKLVEDAILRHVDMDLFHEVDEEIEKHKKMIRFAADHLDEYEEQDESDEDY